MSFEAMQAMLEHSRATGCARTVGLVVALRAEPETNLAWPTNDDLRRFGFPERTIYYALRKLEALGELVRQPAIETRKRQRIYLVTPAVQLSLLEPTSLQGATARFALHPATHARAGKERQELQERQTPQPPQAGEPRSRSSVLSNVRSNDSPLASDVERAAAARRRRDRRRRAGPLAPGAPRGCPPHRPAERAESPKTGREPPPRPAGNRARERERYLAELAEFALAEGLPGERFYVEVLDMLLWRLQSQPYSREEAVRWLEAKSAWRDQRELAQ